MTNIEHRTVQIVRDALAEPAAAIGMDAVRRAVRQESHLADLARWLANRAGGLDALEQLDVEPLPDEPFAWSTVDDVDRELVGQILELVDPVCDEWLDVEYRTIARRLLALVVAHEPGPLRRSKRPARLAAGLLLAVLDGNGAVGRHARWRAIEVAALFHTSSVGDVARVLVRGAGLDAPYHVDTWAWRRCLLLPSTALLHSRARCGLLEDRTQLIGMIEDDERRRAGRRAMVALDDGTTEMHCWPADVALVNKGRSRNGQTMILVGLSPVQPEPELELVALTVPEANRLRQMLDLALGEPASGGTVTPLRRRT